MLFLVISEPRPEPPAAVVEQRQNYWRWIAPLQASGQVKSVHARVGRGAVVLFDVDSHATLHRFLNEWANIIPAHFDTYPLLDAVSAQQFLADQVVRSAKQ
jgi:muconolactone delta-isomerase